MGAAALAEPLALLESVDRDGLVRQSWRIERWPVTIGRALDNTIVLSDPHVAAHHATLDLVAAGPAGNGRDEAAAAATQTTMVVSARATVSSASVWPSASSRARSACASA